MGLLEEDHQAGQRSYHIAHNASQDQGAAKELARPETHQGVHGQDTILLPDVVGAVENPAEHIDAVGEDEAHRSEYARQDVGEHQEADREYGHQVVILVDVLAGVRREHVALADPVHRQQIDGQAVPLQQALRQSAGHKVRPAI